MRLSTWFLVVTISARRLVLGDTSSSSRRITEHGANHPIDDFPRKGRNGDNKFMDNLGTVTDEQKVGLFLHARALERVSEHIDWERLRDNFITAMYSSDNRRRKLKSTQHKPNEKGNNMDLSLIEVDDKLKTEGKVSVATVTTRSKPNLRENIRDNTVYTKKGNSQTSHYFAEKEDSSVAQKKQRNGIDMAIRFEVPIRVDETSQVNSEAHNEGRAESDDGIVIPNYEYSTGNCPDEGDSPRAVPCAPDNIDRICDKADPEDQGKFSLCYEACLPSFCCIHDAPPATNFVAPSCYEDANCASYSCCYIVWWKLHDTIGPATQLQLEASDDFFDVGADFIEGDVTNVEFFREMLFHHFNDAEEIIRHGTVEVSDSLATFKSDIIFLNSTYWNTNI